jgi:uncharacterized protein (DUF4415 family)
MSTKQTASGETNMETRRRPGRPKLDNPKQAISLRLEPDVLAKFRATGPGWQRRMNDVLKAAVIEKPKPQ